MCFFCLFLSSGKGFPASVCHLSVACRCGLCIARKAVTCCNGDCSESAKVAFFSLFVPF